ncbi:hypothetical protein KA005_11010 [bacterium]|nr:hypothetical protein [bacterium]
MKDDSRRSTYPDTYGKGIGIEGTKVPADGAGKQIFIRLKWAWRNESWFEDHQLPDRQARPVRSAFLSVIVLGPPQVIESLHGFVERGQAAPK